MVTKTISGSPLKRVLNRSLTWKETFGKAAPESVAIDKQYADALKAFESISDFPKEWADEQKLFDALSETMRGLEADLVKADAAVRDAHAKRIDTAKSDAEKLAKDVALKHTQNREVATKALTSTCVELRGLRERLVMGLPELKPDLDYGKQLTPAMQELAEIVSRYKRMADRFAKIEEYMGKVFQYPPESIEKLLVKADAAVKKFDTSVRGAPLLCEKLLARAEKVPAPPAKKTFSRLYGGDAAEMEKARVAFQQCIDDLNGDEQAIIKGLDEGIALFSGSEFKALNHWMHMIARYDARREIVEKEASRKSPAKSSSAKPDVTEPKDAPVPALPARPTDATAGRTIKILNPHLAPVSVLNDAEQGKVTTFLALHDQVVPARVRDLMNEHFGSFEHVNHSTVRLSKRRRLEFDIDMTAPTEVRITLVNIGDPTYDH